MNRWSSLRLVFAFCALAVAGCATRGPELVAKGTVAVTLSTDKKSTAATAQLFNLVTLTLPVAKPAYHWQISFHDTRYLKQTTDIVRGEAGPTISFIARTPGRTRLRFMLVPESSGRVVDPVDQQELVLTIE